MKWRLSVLAASAVIAVSSWAAAQADKSSKAPSQPGLYMTFETSMGNIQCKLYEKETPVTVKMMVGLAVGRIPYVDPQTKKEVKGKRLFDGLIFHRVIPQFMIQGGDPLGTGYGGPEGPGFPFKDEFVSSLRFDKAGKLAMANAGPNTNQSQFFITEVPVPFLNNKHTIFGQCDNVDLVKKIARVPKDDNDRPKTPVVIDKVVVERVGPAPADAPEALPANPPR
ncbi:MAG: peptidylprolyl isomerase [Acidobacteria bacterium]|nr:peptidylprolyl isomerase [Acidobacteriota bacterium]